MYPPKSIIVLGLLVLLTGCIYQIHPLYTEKDVIFEPGLNGVWLEAQETWNFSSYTDSSGYYDLIIKDEKKKKWKFEAVLLRINGNIFLDIIPEFPDCMDNEFIEMNFLPVHCCFYVKQIKPALQIAWLNPEYIKRMSENDSSTIRYETSNDNVILTASTEELQEFWLKQITNRDAFDDFTNMKKIKESGK